jgi:septation ring formation regulator EzrA
MVTLKVIIAIVIVLLILAVVGVFVYRNNKAKILAAADKATAVADKVVDAEQKAKDIAATLKK